MPKRTITALSKNTSMDKAYEEKDVDTFIDLMYAKYVADEQRPSKRLPWSS